MGEAKRRGAMLDGRKGRGSVADLFTAKRLNRRHAERDGRGKEGIVFPSRSVITSQIALAKGLKGP